VHGLAGAREVERLQIAQPAVDGAEVIERSAAAEVVSLHQRDRESPLCAVVGDRQAADTAADDENVEGSCCEPVEVALHGRELAAPAILLSAWQPSTKCAPTGSGTFTISRSRTIPWAPAASSRISISIISKNCITCCGWSTSTAIGARPCSKSGVARGSTWRGLPKAARW